MAESKDISQAQTSDDFLASDKSLQCIRIEVNSHVAVFLYYKRYPKENSQKFPQDRTAIVFYFDNEFVNEKFIKNYMSLIGQVDEVEVGSYINRKGSKKKRRVVNFAIVKFLEEEALLTLLDRYQTQLRINEFLDLKRNKNVSLNYDPLKDEEAEEEEEVDEDGFVKVTSDVTKKRFNKNGLSFKVKKHKEEDERKLKDKESKGDFYWNYQLLDKKRQMYEELKNLFEEDKKALEGKSNKKQKKEI